MLNPAIPLAWVFLDSGVLGWLRLFVSGVLRVPEGSPAGLVMGK